MKPNDIATLVLGALTLIWTIWTAVRSSRETKYAARIDGLLKVRSTLESLGTAGLDTAVGQERRNHSQTTQLETVAVALRRASATYVGLVHRAVPSYLAVFAILAYAFWAGVVGIGLFDVRSVKGAPTVADLPLGNRIFGIVFLALCLGLVILAGVQWARARRARIVLKQAGIDLRKPKEKLMDNWTAVSKLFTATGEPPAAPPTVDVEDASQLGLDRDRGDGVVPANSDAIAVG